VSPHFAATDGAGPRKRVAVGVACHQWASEGRSESLSGCRAGHTLMVMTRRHRLLIVLGLNLALIAGLVAVGIAGHSLGLLAVGGDYLADSGAITLALLAIWFRNRSPTPRRPQGYPRATA